MSFSQRSFLKGQGHSECIYKNNFFYTLATIVLVVEGIYSTGEVWLCVCPVPCKQDVKAKIMNSDQSRKS